MSNTQYSDFIALIEHSIRENWQRDALTDYGGETFRYRDVAVSIAKLHILFEQAGLQPGDRIGLYGRNSAHWGIAFLATITYGAVAVPILHDFSGEQAQNIIAHSAARLLFVGDNMISRLQPEAIPELVAVVRNSDYEVQYSRDESLAKMRDTINVHFGQHYPRDFGPEDLHYHRQSDGEALALINYTSGTTGHSKGVMLPYRSLWSNALCAQELCPETFLPGNCIVSMLPMAHMYGLMFELIAGLLVGMHTYYLLRAASPSVILAAFGDVRPHLAICVPLVMEKLLQKTVVPKLERPMLRTALRVPYLRARIMARVKEQMLGAFGGRVAQVVMGGAAFNPELEALLREIGFPYTIGYGTTETGPLITFTHASAFKMGTCGRVAPRMEMHIDSSNPREQVGEILVRGTNLMLGYYNDVAATNAVVDAGGWYHTGDLGTIADDGSLTIRGRCKNMLLTPNGQNVYPEEVESRFAVLPCVKECCMVQRDNKFVMLVYPDFEAAEAKGLSHLDIIDLMERHRRDLNKHLNRYEQLSAIEVRDEEFEKTPKLSIKRYLYT